MVVPPLPPSLTKSLFQTRLCECPLLFFPSLALFVELSAPVPSSECVVCLLCIPLCFLPSSWFHTPYLGPLAHRWAWAHADSWLLLKWRPGAGAPGLPPNLVFFFCGLRG
eukprot:Hpha_TRINITY_DN13045_c0_g1::TRINITY_DN13045_c0_g1_i1::g.68704::m.68704